MGSLIIAGPEQVQQIYQIFKIEESKINQYYSNFLFLSKNHQYNRILLFVNKYMYGGEQRESLDHFQGLHRQVQREIQDNHAQIRLLNNKIVKSDYDHTNLQKLEERHRILLNKRLELEEIVKNHEFLQQQILQQKSNDNSFKHSLGNQYIQLSQEKKKKIEEERRKAIEQEKQMHQYHRRSLEEEHIRKKMAMEEQRRAAQEELALREQIRQRERAQKQKQKEQYNKKLLLRSQIETQKDSVYKQYYHQFMDNQEVLQNIYKNKALVSDRQKQVHRDEFQRKQIEEFQHRVARQQQDRVQRINQEKDMLRSFLQNQIEEKQRRKSRDRQEELGYQAQVARYQISAAESQVLQKVKKKEDQRRYDQQLRSQTRSRSYHNGYGPLDGVNRPHNPITNPIDFKIGITNPYIIRQYEQTKEKYLGDPQLKLRNLAMVGSNSLNHQ